VDDHVRARLGHRQLDVGQDLRLEVEALAQAAESVSHDGDVLRASGQGELDVWHVGRK